MIRTRTAHIMARLAAASIVIVLIEAAPKLRGAG